MGSLRPETRELSPHTFLTRNKAHIWGVVNDNSVEAITVLFGPDDKLGRDGRFHDNPVTDLSFKSVMKNAIETPVKLGLKVFSKYYTGLKKREKVHREVMKGVPHWRIMYK